VTTPLVVVMLTDAQLAEEIDVTEAEVCCSSYGEAAAALCGCRGAAADYLARLRGEAQQRSDARAVARAS
jgi:hypothetical protein